MRESETGVTERETWNRSERECEKNELKRRDFRERPKAGERDEERDCMRKDELEEETLEREKCIVLSNLICKFV